jgi:hypothetical protein
VLDPPPPLPPQASAARAPDTMIERRILFMYGVRTQSRCRHNASKLGCKLRVAAAIVTRGVTRYDARKCLLSSVARARAFGKREHGG